MDPITKETDMSDALELAEAHNRAFNDRAWHRAPEIYSPDLLTVEPGDRAPGL